MSTILYEHKELFTPISFCYLYSWVMKTMWKGTKVRCEEGNMMSFKRGARKERYVKTLYKSTCFIWKHAQRLFHELVIT